MSEDLDADLYADLYGDEEANASTQPKTERPEKPAVEAKTPAAASSTTPATYSKETKPLDGITQTTDPRQNKPPPVSAIPTVPTTVPVTTQEIPTYSSSTGSTTAPIQSFVQSNSNSQPIAVAPLTSTVPTTYGIRPYQSGTPIPSGQQYEHRGVRPSEMKEEG